MIKKLVVLTLSLLSLNALAYTHDHLLDLRMNGTSWEGLEYGLFYTADGKQTADYNKQLLLFDVGINFVEDELTWHDEESGEWDISPITICQTKLSRTTERNALKVWEETSKTHQDELNELERVFSSHELHIDVMSDTTLRLFDAHVKIHMVDDQLIVDLKKENDTTIVLNTSGSIAKTINFCNDFPARITDLKPGMPISKASWTYWIEGKMFNFCFGHENYILRCPFKMSADGKTYNLVLKRKKD